MYIYIYIFIYIYDISSLRLNQICTVFLYIFIKKSLTIFVK